MEIKIAERDDLESILELQYIAYQTEARLLNNFSIPPLTETLDELMKEYDNGKVYKTVDGNGVIIGSVRGYVNNQTLFIGKLMVHPDFRGKGIGTSLLNFIENDNKGFRYELFTSDKSLNNLKLYEKCGYKRFKTEAVAKDFNFIYLEK